MSHIVPASFDPFATHPFTNNSAVVPQAPYPSPYARHVQPALNGGSLYPPPQQQPQTFNQAPSQTPMYAPQPQRAPANQQPQQQQHKHIFEQFKLDRSSPDLKDILVKKSSSKAPSQRSK